LAQYRADAARLGASNAAQARRVGQHKLATTVMERAWHVLFGQPDVLPLRPSDALAALPALRAGGARAGASRELRALAERVEGERAGGLNDRTVVQSGYTNVAAEDEPPLLKGLWHEVPPLD
jgi:hypothetical protein